jgi:tetratricopeptide (TPR) repeat protein
LLEKQGQYAEALTHAQEALRVVHEIGPAWTEAALENSVGWIYGHLGQYDDALAYCQHSLDFMSAIGHRSGEADVWDSLGYIHNRRQDFPQAVGCYTHAVEIYHEIGDRFHEAGSCIGLGDALLRVGESAAAKGRWGQALIILESIPHHDAERARVRLRQLDKPQG